MKAQIHKDVAGVNIGRVWIVWSRFGGTVPVSFRFQRYRVGSDMKYKFWRLTVGINDKPKATP